MVEEGVISTKHAAYPAAAGAELKISSAEATVAVKAPLVSEPRVHFVEAAARASKQ